MTSRLAFLILIISISSAIQAQTTILEFFTANENRGDVVLNWAILAGNTCNGIDIMRSTDSLNFSEIGHIEGICGDEERTISYTHVDENPIYNRKVFYRLELGQVGSSEIISIQLIDFTQEEYLVQPNPFQTESSIYFKNDNNSMHELQIFTIEGKLIEQKSGDSDRFPLDGDSWQSGLYVFTIQNLSDNSVISGKFLVYN